MQDWTRFRGPNGTGIGVPTGVAADYTDKDIRWKATLPGEGHSSPVLMGESVFVTAAQRETGKRHLICLDTKTGKERWRQSFDYKAYHTHELNTAASATPTVDKERVYSTWPAPESFVVVAHTLAGKEVWRRDFGEFPTQHGGGSASILHDGLLIFSREPENAPGSLLALDVKTGQTRWEVKRPSKDAPYAVPMLYQPTPTAPVQLLFCSTLQGITSVEAKTGKVLWETPGLFTYRCVGSPVAAGGLIFAGTGVGNGSRLFVALKPGTSGAKPEVAWKLTRGTPYVPCPLYANDLLFLWGDGGIVNCVKPESGETIWQERVGGNFYGSPVFCEGKLWAMSNKGELIVIAAEKTFKVLGRHELGEITNATPAFGEKTLYLRTLSHLTAVGGK
ncbi:PQQ-binding-like beta-propeller repeat protein [Armatimonas sp.]|uniref:PQQ-like beta-propeller repeat protein n=1 Tax=Armatimonas sp. TaxID=1872638 RepID=UPI00286CDC29|nr:PQQ-binding-like beta-propeller repeat protein [Armatimonas sp.]